MDVIYPLMAALMLVGMVFIMDVLVGMLLALVIVSMFMLIICVATHLTSPPSLDNIRYVIDYKRLLMKFFST
jgi:hypothetical protein